MNTFKCKMIYKNKNILMIFNKFKIKGKNKGKKKINKFFYMKIFYSL